MSEYSKNNFEVQTAGAKGKSMLCTLKDKF